MKLKESVPEGSREHFSAAILSGWVLGSKKSEPTLSHNCFLGLRQEELSVIVQDSVQRLKHISWGEVELVKNDPGSIEHCLSEHAKLEDQLALGVRRVGAKIFLDVRVLVVVHPHTLVPCQLRQVGDKGRLAYAGVSLSEKGYISSRF